MPSITTWMRLEPICRDPDLRTGPQARVFDPLWLLARQWQIGELNGEDAGTPIQAHWQGRCAPITRFWPGQLPAGQVPGQPCDLQQMPLETLVERRPRPPLHENSASLRWAVDSGLLFMRLLDDAKLGTLKAPLLQHFALAQQGTGMAGTQPEARELLQLMAGRVPDGRRLAAFAKAAASTTTPAWPPAWRLAAAQRKKFIALLLRWDAEQRALWSLPDPAAGDDSWQRDRFEYSFHVAAHDGQQETVLSAHEYLGGRLDWYHLDAWDGGARSLAASVDAPLPGIDRRVIPSPVNFTGAPARRFWEMEDTRLDFSLVPMSPGDVAQLLLCQQATAYGHDWFQIPVDLPVGHLVRSDALIVTDTFGLRTSIPPTNAGAQGWSLYQQARADDTSQSATNLLYLAPALTQSLEARPVEDVTLLRDEMANLAWAVESTVEGVVEQRVARAAAPPPSDSAPDADGLPSYRLATAVAPNWIPLGPVRLPAGADGEPGALVLQRAILQPLTGAASPAVPQGALIGSGALQIPDEEVPREGVRLTTQVQFARWINGHALLWSSHRKQPGRGEGSSGLQFDVLR